MRGMRLPLIHMQVRRHVGSETGSGRRVLVRLDGEVIVAPGLLHAQVPEVEVCGSHGMGGKQGLRGRQVASVAPRARQWRRVHSGERRGHLHGCFEGARGAESRWIGRWLLGQTRVASNALFTAPRRDLASEAGRRAISIQLKTRKLILI